VCRVLHAAGRGDVPVALGADGPPRPDSPHGHDGLGGYAERWSTGELRPVVEPAGELLRRLTADRPGAVDLVTIGPLSTLAGALALDPEIAGRTRSLTVMGGTNLDLDPGATNAALAADWPAAPLMIGFDVTLGRLLHTDDLPGAGVGTAAALLGPPLWAYAASSVRRGRVPPGRCPAHDLVAVMATVAGEIPDEAQLRAAVRGLWQESPET
jgi:inosine-uridine nucleoside N-ribohydrolase